MPPSSHTPEQKKKAVEEYLNGRESAEIATELGIHPSTLTRWVKAAGHKPRSAGKHVIPTKAIPSIVERYKNGESYSSLGREFGVDGTVIAFHVHKVIESRPAGDSHRRYWVREDLFDISPSTDETAAYFLGFFATDGCLARNGKNSSWTCKLKLQVRDGYIVEKLAEWLGVPEAVHHRKKVSEFCLTSPPLCDWVRLYGITERKTFTLKVSDEATASRHFWRGAVDGDGCLTWGGKSPYFVPGVNFVSASKDFIEQYHDFVRSVTETSPRISVKPSPKSKNPLYQVTIAGYNGRRLIEHLYGDSTISLPRKLDKARRAIAWVPKKPRPKSTSVSQLNIGAN